MNLNRPFETNKIFANNSDWQHFPLTKIINQENDKLTDELSKFVKVSGIYIFWWTGSANDLEKLNRKILLQGKKVDDTFHWHPIEWQMKWLVPIEIEKRKHYALYVGKSTTLRSRIRQHFHFPMSHEVWAKQLQNPLNKLGKSKLEYKGMEDHHNGGHIISYNPTTSCQFRAGMSLLCRDEADEMFWDFVKQNVKLSIFSNEKKNNSKESEKKCFVAERFYLEDFLIGALRPWFNLDSER
jgi:hypothetical protein